MTLLRQFVSRAATLLVAFAPVFVSACGSSTVETSRDASTVSTGDPNGPLPCDVQNFLQTYCVSCHGGNAALAPEPLVTRTDLLAPSTDDPSKTYAQVAVDRLGESYAPMPPPPSLPVPADAVAAFRAWVAAGSPTGTCDPPVDVFAQAAACTSGAQWTRGNRGSDEMNPGEACIACHATSRSAPRFSIAGTVYATPHDPNTCNGDGNDPITVEITDAAGHVLRLTPDAVGNFDSRTTVTPPYNARVVTDDGRERRMGTAQMSGDCNSCHTPTGVHNAPGRIVAP